jgi:SAM-dependent methyltransferase
MAVTSSDIYDRPDVYELEYAESEEEDSRFYARALGRLAPSRILELACGSGRVTFALATALRSAHVVGVDSSPDMLARATTAGAACAPGVAARVTMHEGDMRAWPGDGRPFDAVVIPCCAVSHLLTLDDRLKTWRTAWRLLRPGGAFLVDVRSPDLATLSESQRVKPRAFVDLDIDATRQSLGDEARLLRCAATTYEPHLQLANVRLLYDRFDAHAVAERFVMNYQSHVYFPAELELLFRATGFDVVAQFGDYAFGALGRTSPFHITLARKPLQPPSIRQGFTESGQ